VLSLKYSKLEAEHSIECTLNSRRPLDRLFVLFHLDLLPNINWWASYRDGL